jgi:site-specific recombinase XerD
MQGNSVDTEDAYCRQVRRYLTFLCGREWKPDATPESKAEAFLTAEADRDVAASTQNGAFHAICYYYRHIRKVPLVGVDALRAKVGEKVRHAPSKEDTRKILMAVADSSGYPTRLICLLLYGCGLRVTEGVSIRLKDIDLDKARLTMIEGKGKKDRFINIPPSLIPMLRLQVQAAEAAHAKAKEMGVPVKLPHRYAEKNPAAKFQKRWAWLFPMHAPCDDPRGAGRVWWHCLAGVVQSAMRSTNKRAGTEGITPHHLRHAWATHARDLGARVEDIQEALGHKDIKTTLRYIHPDAERVPSPIETLNIAI